GFLGSARGLGPFARLVLRGEQLLAFGLRALAIADVPENDRVDLLLRALDLGNASLHRELFAVAPKPGEDALATHRPRAHARHAESIDVPLMDISESLGDEPVEGLSQHFVRLVSEHR